MKQYLAIMLLSSSILITSCESNSKKELEGTKTELNNLKMNKKMKEEQLKNNKEIALNLSRAIMTGDWVNVEELLSDDFTYVGDGRPAMNKQEYIGFMKGVLSTAFTDMNMKFLRVIAEGNLVSVDYTNTMKHVGNWFGVPATQKIVVASGQFMREVQNGKVTAEWQTTNGVGLMMQLTGKQ